MQRYERLQAPFHVRVRAALRSTYHFFKNSSGCRRDVRVKMWGASSPDDKLIGDLAKATEATKIAGRRSDPSYGGKIITTQFRTFATISALMRLHKLVA